MNINDYSQFSVCTAIGYLDHYHYQDIEDNTISGN